MPTFGHSPASNSSIRSRLTAMTDAAPVLIAGGGLVGLSAATFLAQQGIRSVTIERLRASSPLPRAAFFHMRTLEMFRSVGIESRMRRSEEHTSELQSQSNLVCRLLLEKKRLNMLRT